MNHPDVKGSYDAGVHRCSCGSMLFMEVLRLCNNGTEAKRHGTLWCKCASCGNVYYNEEPYAEWHRWFFTGTP